MSPDMQVKLLRFLNDKRITPVGSYQSKEINVRIISATNESLEDLIAAKKFREDLFFRLKAVTFEIPPLRDRLEDLEDLVKYFLDQSGNGHKTLSADAWELCKAHRWPGNVRELKNAIEVGNVMADGDQITTSDLGSQLQIKKPSPVETETSSQASEMPFALTKEMIRNQFNAVTEKFEQALVGVAYKEMGSVQGAAKYLGISRNSLN